MKNVATKADIQEIKALIERKTQSMLVWFVGILSTLALGAILAWFESGL